MKAKINAPYSVLHERNCDVLENYTETIDGDEKRVNIQTLLCKVDGYPNPLPIHTKELDIIGHNCDDCKKENEELYPFAGSLLCMSCLPF